MDGMLYLTNIRKKKKVNFVLPQSYFTLVFFGLKELFIDVNTDPLL